ncbi:MAG: hypothetical protein ACT6FE_02110 [Methanosarcinaceae archaeon]
MKQNVYAMVLLMVFFVSAFTFSIVIETVGYGESEHEIEFPEALEDMTFENMGRKTLESVCMEYNVSMDELMVELELPQDTDPQTRLSDLSLEGDLGDMVEVAVIKMKHE